MQEKNNVVDNGGNANEQANEITENPIEVNEVVNNEPTNEITDNVVESTTEQTDTLPASQPQENKSITANNPQVNEIGWIKKAMSTALNADMIKAVGEYVQETSNEVKNINQFVKSILKDYRELEADHLKLLSVYTEFANDVKLMETELVRLRNAEAELQAENDSLKKNPEPATESVKTETPAAENTTAVEGPKNITKPVTVKKETGAQYLLRLWGL